MSYTCEDCNKFFERKFDLNRHYKSNKHLNNTKGIELIKDFYCKDCDITFINNQRLQKHLKSIKHNLKVNPNLFKCNLKQGRRDCNKKFKTNKKLQQHIAEDHYDIPELAEYIIEDFFNKNELNEKDIEKITNEEYFNDNRKTTPSYFCDLLKYTIFNKKFNPVIKGDNKIDNYNSKNIYYNFNGTTITIPINIQLVASIVNRVIDKIKEIDKYYENYLDRIVFKDDPYNLKDNLYDTDEMNKETKQELVKKFKVLLK